MFNAGYVVYLSFGPRMLAAQGMGTLAAASVISVGNWLMSLSGTACGQIADRFGRDDPRRLHGGRGSVTHVAEPAWAGLTASLLFGLVGRASAGVIMALAGQAVAPERRAFCMGSSSLSTMPS